MNNKLYSPSPRFEPEVHMMECSHMIAVQVLDRINPNHRERMSRMLMNAYADILQKTFPGAMQQFEIDPNFPHETPAQQFLDEIMALEPIDNNLEYHLRVNYHLLGIIAELI